MYDLSSWERDEANMRFTLIHSWRHVHRIPWMTFSNAVSKLKAESSNFFFHWNVAKETFELWAFGNDTLSGNGCMGWLRSVGSIKLQVSFAEYRLFYRALLQKRHDTPSGIGCIRFTLIHSWRQALRHISAGCLMDDSSSHVWHILLIQLRHSWDIHILAGWVMYDSSRVCLSWMSHMCLSWMSHMCLSWMSYVSQLDESCMSQLDVSYMSKLDESGWVMSHECLSWMRHVT